MSLYLLKCLKIPFDNVERSLAVNCSVQNKTLFKWISRHKDVFILEVKKNEKIKRKAFHSLRLQWV